MTASRGARRFPAKLRLRRGEARTAKAAREHRAAAVRKQLVNGRVWRNLNRCFEGRALMRDAVGFDGLTSLPEVTLPLRFAGLILNLDACTLVRDSGDAILLTRGEFALLKMFATRPGRAVSRDRLLDSLTNRRFEPFDRSVDVLVGRLRKKIETDPKKPRLIVTVPGEGYRFDGMTQSSPPQQKSSISVLDPGSDPPLAERPAALGEAGEATIPVPDLREPPRFYILVLPFANIGGDPEQ
jgi:DNA-binding response OmpR family regulator